MGTGHQPLRLSSGFDSRARISKAPTVDTAVIFVHGFGGHPETTWLELQTLIDTDPRAGADWERCDLFFFGYASVDRPIRYNAALLRKFVSGIYPEPDLSLFEITLEGQSFMPTAILRSGFKGYTRLILVGHSEGAVLLRTIIRDSALSYEQALKEQPSNQAPSADRTNATSEDVSLRERVERELLKIREKILRDQPQHNVLMASLRLFAPAHSGHSISGVFGSILSMPGIGSIVRSALQGKTSYSDLKPTSPLITCLRDDTQLLASRMPWLSSLRAKILWGDRETIVYMDKFHYDSEETITGKNHLTICKPTSDYLRPLEFVLEGDVVDDPRARQATV
jgi:hypothetical protein